MHSRIHVSIRRLALLGIFTVAAGCHSAASATVLSPLNEREAAALLLLANAAEAGYAEVAMSRTSRADVRDFARRLGTDHSSLGITLGDVLARVDVTPASDEVTSAYRERGLARRAALRAVSDAAFDSTYAANEVMSHQELLQLIDQQIAPAARHRPLSDYLAALRPAVRAHLAHAEQVRATLMAR